MTARHQDRAWPRGNAQRGVVLLVALVAVLALALSASALVRGVDATIAVTGNLGFHHAAASASDAAIEGAYAALFERRLIADTASDDAAQAYYASHQAGEDARAVPRALQDVADYPPGAPVIDAGSGNVVRYVIERMCVGPGPATASQCTLYPAPDPVAEQAGNATTAPPPGPVFRQTIRVDGPRSATYFTQVWLADYPPRRRVSWRALAQ